MNGLPDFISQNPRLIQQIPPIDAQLPPSYGFDDVGIRLFPLLADMGRLQKICDYFLNDVAAANGQTFRIEPIQSIVLMEILSYPKMFSRVPEQQALGYSTQNEFLFAIPVVYRNKFGIPLAVGLFLPFLCVDNDWSLISGRDVVGFPKVYGDITVPKVFASAHPLKVDARVLKTFDPGSESKMAPLLEIEDSLAGASPMMALEPVDPAFVLTDLDPKTVWPYGPLDRLYSPTEGLLPVTEAIYNLLLQSAGIGVRNYSLKQFRDAKDTGKAAYQSIVESELVLEGFDSVGQFVNTNIKLHEYASIRLIEAFGLQLAGNFLKPIYQIRYKGDFSFNILDSLFTSCGQSSGHAGDRSCLDLLGSGAALTCGLVRRQLDVARRICETAANGRCHPQYFADDLQLAGRNAVSYCSRMSELTVEGVSHLFRR